jgi:putative ABC transport system permease protein
MMLVVALKLALYDRIRFLVTTLGVGFAVTLVIVQVGLLQGLLESATTTIDRAAADIWITSRNTPNVDFAHPFPDSYVQRVRTIPGVSLADNLVVFYVFITLPTGAEETLLAYGVPSAGRWGLPWDVAEGDLEDLHAGRTMFLDDSAAARLGAFRVGDYREVSGTRLRVVGRTRQAKSFTTVPMAFLDRPLLQRIVPDFLEGKTSYILVRLAPGADAGIVADQIRARLPHNDVYTREAWSERSRTYWLTTTGLGMNMYLTVFLGALVGLIVVAQTLYAAAMEHLREFGTLKAIGATNGEVYGLLGWQAVVVAVAGFATGLVPSLTARELLPRLASLEVRTTPSFLGIVLTGTFATCLLASVIAFRKVASVDPALVFRG